MSDACNPQECLIQPVFLLIQHAFNSTDKKGKHTMPIRWTSSNLNVTVCKMPNKKVLVTSLIPLFFLIYANVGLFIPFVMLVETRRRSSVFLHSCNQSEAARDERKRLMDDERMIDGLLKHSITDCVRSTMRRTKESLSSPAHMLLTGETFIDICQGEGPIPMTQPKHNPESRGLFISPQ
jgi:hypothetical protein